MPPQAGTVMGEVPVRVVDHLYVPLLMEDVPPGRLAALHPENRIPGTGDFRVRKIATVGSASKTCTFQNRHPPDLLRVCSRYPLIHTFIHKLSLYTSIYTLSSCHTHQQFFFADAHQYEKAGTDLSTKSTTPRRATPFQIHF